MNKDAGDFIRNRRLRFSSAVMSDRAEPAAETRDGQPAFGGRRPILNIIRRRARFIAAVALTGTALIGVAALAVPPSYTATAQLMVRPTSSEIAASLLGPVIDTHIAMMTSVDCLRRVLKRRPKMDSSAAFVPERGPPTTSDRLRKALMAATAAAKAALFPARPAQDGSVAEGSAQELAALKNSLLVRQERLSSIVAVSAMSKNPYEATATVNELVTLHVEQLAERKRRDTEMLRSLQDADIEGARRELKQAEDALTAFQAVHGTVGPDDTADLIAEVQRQLAQARADLRLRELAQNRANVPANDDESNASSESRRVGQLEFRLRNLQDKSRLAFRERMDQQALELRIASARKLLDDMMVRRQEDTKDSTQSFAADARVFSLATVPSRPSSTNPLLLVPPAFVAFSVLGVALAVLIDRMDHTVRSVREAEDAAGFPCLGLIPRLLPHSYFRWSRSLKCREQLRADALEAVSQSIAQLYDGRRGLRIILITSGCDADDKQDFAIDLGSHLACTEYRVMVMRIKDRQTASGSARCSVQAAAASGDDCSSTRNPNYRFDPVHAAAQEITGLLSRSGERFEILQASYDYIIIDAPPALLTMNTRILAAKVDGVVLGLRWGATRRETISETLLALRRVAEFSSEFNVDYFTVLTDVDPNGFWYRWPAIV
ncbi:GumC family protein [Methylobacterium sp. CM6257]